ncbi:MAG: LPXTG cell wall anchor domain-containing protein [Clostridia bacterium]|nr:LPXTG cell wall anchor domain-containing protein [Clostridia bacterium]
MTKEKMALLLIAISMLVIAIFPTTVQAVETQEEKWTDFGNAKMEIIGESTNKNISIEDATSITYKIKISNIILNPEREYLVYFHNKDEEVTASKVQYHYHAKIKEGNTEATINSVWMDYFLQRNKDIYVSVLEKNNEKTNLVVTARNMQRPELFPKIGNRLHIYFSSNSTNIYFWAPNVNEKNGSKIARNLKIKIGQVSDPEILKTIKNSKAKGLQQLLTYAKKVKEYNYTGTIKYDGKAGITETLTSKMKLKNGEYYFAYIELDDENGLYYPVEDIALYHAKGTQDLVRYSDKEFVWKITDETKTPTQETSKPEDNKEEQKPQQEQTKKEENTTQNTNTVKKPNDTTTAKGTLPQTGEKTILVAVIATGLLAGIGYAKYKKYQDIK